MPIYEYKCNECEAVTEVRHAIAETPQVECAGCGSVDTRKIISPCTFTVHATGRRQQHWDNAKRESDMRQELREDYNVHNAIPIGAPGGLAEVHREVKANGEQVRERMSAKREQSASEAAAKHKEFKRTTGVRSKKKVPLIKERRAKEAAAKRRITLR